MQKALAALEEYLSSRTFLVGNSVTLADIITVANLYHGFTKVLDHCSAVCAPAGSEIRIPFREPCSNTNMFCPVI